MFLALFEEKLTGGVKCFRNALLLLTRCMRAVPRTVGRCLSLSPYVEMWFLQMIENQIVVLLFFTRGDFA